MKLSIELPATKLDPLKKSDEAFDFATKVIIEAERQLPGIDLEMGRRRLALATDVMMEALVLPALNPRAFAKLYVKTVYVSIARRLPDHMRASKTEPPSPERR